MTSNDDNSRRRQFTLAGLMTLVTVVAAVCATSRFVANEGIEMLLLLLLWVIMFWPSLLFLAQCGGLRLVQSRFRGIVATVLLLVVATGVGLPSLAVLIYLVAIVVAWPPQAFLLWIIHLDLRDWDRRHGY